MQVARKRCASFRGADVSVNHLQVRIFVQLYIYAGPPHTRGHIIVTSAGGVTRSRPAYVDDYKVFISLYIRVLYGMCVAYPSLCSAYDFRLPLFFQMSLTQKLKDAFREVLLIHRYALARGAPLYIATASVQSMVMLCI